MATEKMRTGQTYSRPPSKGSPAVNSSIGTSGKVVGKKAPTVVNNSSQGRNIPKKPR